jgi:hypothetical protein
MKKLTATVFAAALAVAASATAFAQDGSAQDPTWGRMPGWGGGGGMWGMMSGWGGGGSAWGMMTDRNGNLLSRDAFIERLDKAVASGLVASADRQPIVDLYDRLQSGDGVAVGPGGFNRGRFAVGSGARGGRWVGRGCGW